MRGTPRWTIKLGGVLGIALLLSGLTGAGLAGGEIASTGQVTRAAAWAVIFELSIALSGVFAAMLMLGKFRSGPCMTMLVTGGCAALGVPLMDLSIATGLIGRGSDFLTFSGVSSAIIAIANLVPAFGLIGSRRNVPSAASRPRRSRVSSSAAGCCRLCPLCTC